MFENDTIISKYSQRSPKSSEEVQSLPKPSVCDESGKSPRIFPVPVLGRVYTRARSECFSLQKSEIVRKVFSFIHFTHGFRLRLSSHIFGNCVSFFNQAREIGPQAWAGVRSKFSTRRGETRALGVRVGRFSMVRWVSTVQPPKWSQPRNDPQPWNDPQIDPEMIPTPKWSPLFFLSTPKWSPRN